MLKHLTLRSPGRSGAVGWDDEAGTFSGTDATELVVSAQVIPWHPGLPSVDSLPAHDARALIILLHILGWDVPPELAEEAKEWFEGQPPFDPNLVY